LESTWDFDEPESKKSGKKDFEIIHTYLFTWSYQLVMLL
jgi:hypothetical protein